MRSPIGSIKEVRAKLVRKGGGISHTTVSRRLSKEFNQKSYKPDKKTRLTAAMKVKGLEFASNHQHLTAEQWVKVHFSDKSPSNSLWFERGSSVDQLENVLIRDAPYQQGNSLLIRWFGGLYPEMALLLSVSCLQERL